MLALSHHQNTSFNNQTNNNQKHFYLIICYQQSKNYVHFTYLGPLCISFVMRLHFWVIQRYHYCFLASTFAVVKAWSLLQTVTTNKHVIYAVVIEWKWVKTKLRFNPWTCLASFWESLFHSLHCRTNPPVLFCSYYKHKVGPRRCSRYPSIH